MKRYIVFLILIAVVEISISLYLTHWRENFWNAIVAKDSHVFLQQIGVFTSIALTLCFLTGFSGYLINLITIKWREILNKRALDLKHRRVENVSQRIQQDCLDYPELFLTIGWGMIKAICYIIVFAMAMVSSFAWYYLLVLSLYGLIGTMLTKKIALPLVSLNYQTQQAEASYRTGLHVRDFSKCIALMRLMAIKQKYLAYFQSFYGQVGVVVPYILIAPVYFLGGMKVGELMRFTSTAATILENLSYGVSSFGVINKLLSCKERLKELGVL